MMRNATRHSPVLAIALLGALALTGCTTDTSAGAADEDSGPVGVPEGVVELPDQEWFPVDDQTTLGGSDEEIPSKDEIPQKLHVGEIDPIGADEVVVVGSQWDLQVVSAAVDPATGEVTASFTTGPGIWDAVLHPFVGADSDDPAMLAQEVWRPRGSRGAADFTVSTYSGTLLEPDEIEMPKYTRAHSRWGSSVVTDDGKYFAFWDDALFGLRVYDLEQGKESGALPAPGCGPFTWTSGHKIYSVCEESRELVEYTIAKNGSVKETGREEVLPADFVSNRHASLAYEADRALLVSANGDVYVFDFADGLPTSEVEPIGNAGQDSGRFDESVLNNTATSMVVGYTDSEIHPDSVDGGEQVKLIISDPDTFATRATLDLASMQLASISGFAYSVDGDTLYVTGSDAEEATVIVGFDALTGAEVSRATITDFTDSPSRVLTPQVIG